MRITTLLSSVFLGIASGLTFAWANRDGIAPVEVLHNALILDGYLAIPMCLAAALICFLGNLYHE